MDCCLKRFESPAIVLYVNCLHRQMTILVPEHLKFYCFYRNPETSLYSVAIHIR